MKNTFKILVLGLSAASLMACSSDGARQIDRMGRAAVNTALNQTFTDAETRSAAEDVYNQTSYRAGQAVFKDEFANNLGIYDALVGDCADNDVTNRLSTENTDLGTATDATRYDLLGTVLADDQLYVVGANGTCSQYLAAEVTLLGIDASTDCGGRAPSYDVIDVTYAAVAAGSNLAAVPDGIASPGDTSDTVFPFLAAPVN